MGLMRLVGVFRAMNTSLRGELRIRTCSGTRDLFFPQTECGVQEDPQERGERGICCRVG